MLQGIYHMTPRQFHKAIEAGVFGENRVELLGGIPFIMSEDPPHIRGVGQRLRGVDQAGPSAPVVRQ